MIYPVNHPDNPGFVSTAWTLLSAVATSRSPFTYKAQQFVWPGERLGCVVALPPMRRDLGMEWEAFFTSLNGTEGTFLFGPSDFATEQSLLGIPETVGISNGETITTTNWTASIASALIPGSWVSIGGRLRKILKTVTTSATGTATISVWPKVTSIAEGTEVIYRNPKGRFRLSEAPPEFLWRVDRFLESMTFTIIEDDFDNG